MIKNAAKLLGGNLILVALQGIQFLLLARALGAATFGKVAIIGTMVAMLIPLSDLGMGHLLLRFGAIAPNTIGYWLRKSIAINLIASFTLTGATTALLFLLYGSDFSIPLGICICLTEYLLIRSIWIAGQAKSALEDFNSTVTYMVLSALCKIAGVMILYLTDSTNPVNWALGTLIVSTIVASIIVGKNIRLFAKISPKDDSPAKYWLRESTGFSLSDLSRSVTNEVDKVLLGRLAGPDILGFYTAAYRLIGFALAPIRAIVQSNRTKLYRLGASEPELAFKAGIKAVFMGLPVSILLGASLYFIAPYVPHILGDSYQNSVEAVRFLSFLPILSLVSLICNDMLAALGKGQLRLTIQLFAICAMCAVGLLVIQSMGWKGAVITCYVGELTLNLCMTVCILRARRKIQVK